MGFLPLTKNLCLLLLIISASFVSISSAGRQSKFISTRSLMTQESLGANEEASTNINENDEFNVHERLLRANAHDYGRFDASPSLPRPRHKLIPN